METSSLAQVAGRNARQRRLDADATLEQVAAAARRRGLPWTSGRVGDFEAGRVAPTLPTLVAVALTLSDVTGESVTLGQLFAGAGNVAVNDAVTIPLDNLRAALGGEPVRVAAAPDVVVRESDGTTLVVQGAQLAARFVFEADMRVVKSIGAAPDRAASAMNDLWGRPLSAERDARAGAGASAQRKGQITRQLREELEAALADKSQREKQGR